MTRKLFRIAAASRRRGGAGRGGGRGGAGLQREGRERELGAWVPEEVLVVAAEYRARHLPQAVKASNMNDDDDDIIIIIIIINDNDNNNNRNV